MEFFEMLQEYLLEIVEAVAIIITLVLTKNKDKAEIVEKKLARRKAKNDKLRKKLQDGLAEEAKIEEGKKNA